MKLTIQQAIQLSNVINQLYQANPDGLPGIFEFQMSRNARILQEELKPLQEKDIEDRQKVLDVEVDMPLGQIKPKDLPDNTLPGTTRALELLIEGAALPETNSIQSALDELDKEDESELESVSENGQLVEE